MSITDLPAIIGTVLIVAGLALVGVAPVHDTGLGSIDDELQTWCQLTNGGS